MTSDFKQAERWLPRLNDSSVDVQERATEVIAEVLDRTPGLRDKLVPALLELLETSVNDRLLHNAICNVRYLPRNNSSLAGVFFGSYVAIVAKGLYHSTASALEEAHWLLKNKLVAREHPRLAELSRLSIKYLQGVDNDATRRWAMEITDWVEDNCP